MIPIAASTRFSRVNSPKKCKVSASLAFLLLAAAAPLLKAQTVVPIPNYGGTGITEIGLAPTAGSIDAQEGIPFTDVFGEANTVGGFWYFWENPTGQNGSAAGATGDSFNGNNWGQIYFANGTVVSSPTNNQAVYTTGPNTGNEYEVTSYTLGYVPNPGALDTAIFAPIVSDSITQPPTPIQDETQAGIGAGGLEINYQYYPGDATPSSTYTVALGSNTVGETIALSNYSQPQGTAQSESPSFVLSGTYTSSSDAVFQSQAQAQVPIMISGSGTFKTPQLSIAGLVDVTSGTLQGDQTYIDTAIPTSFPQNYLAAGYGGYLNIPPSATLTVSGANSVFNASSFVVVGASPLGQGFFATGPATLLLQQGATANVGIVSIGENTGSNGTVTIDASTLNANNQVQVGAAGTGAMTVQNGGTVNVTTSNGNVVVGAQSGGVGTLTITGAGSTMTVAGQVAVGAPNSTGNTLLIEKGGTLTCGDGTAATYFGVVAGQSGGAFSNSGGSVTIDGGGSSWIINGSLSIGSGGNGMVTVQNGGTLQVAGSTIELGHYPGTTGTLTFDGSSGTNPNLQFIGGQGQIVIGDQGTGNLNIQGGAQITSSGGVMLGNVSGSEGNVNVAGTGSMWQTSGDLTIGQGGTASATVQTGGTLQVGGDLNISAGADSDGTLTADGNTTVLDVDGNLTLGQDGSPADFTLSDGATLNLNGDDGGGTFAVVRAAASTTKTTDWIIDGGSNPQVISGSMVNVNGNNVEVGYSTSNNSLYIGSNSSVKGVASLGIGANNSTTNNKVTIGVSTATLQATDIYVGGVGSGELDVNNGSVLLANTGTLYAGLNSGAGVIKVDGGSIALANSASGFFNVDIGGSGQGSLTVTDGGKMQNIGGLQIGASGNTSNNSVMITNAGTLSAGLIDVGAGGTGSLTLQELATAFVGGLDFGGQPMGSVPAVSGGTGTMQISQSSELDISGYVAATFGGTAKIMVDSSGQLVVDGDVTIQGASSTVNVTGMGSSLNVSGGSIVFSGTQVMVQSGGAMSASSSLILDSNNGQSNTSAMATVSGGGTVSAGQIFVGGGASLGFDTSGTAALAIGSTGKVTVATQLTNYVVGTVDLSGGGSLTIGSGTQASAYQLVLNSGGTLTNYGTINLGFAPSSQLIENPGGVVGNLGKIIGGVIVGGTYRDGGDPVSSEIEGDLDIQSTGVLEVPIYGSDPSEYNHLTVTGDTTVEGLVDLDFQDGFAPQAGDIYDLFTFDGAAPSLVGNLEVSGLEPGWQYEVSTQGDELLIDSLNNGIALPEPSGFVLLILGASILAARRFGRAMQSRSSWQTVP